VAIAQFVWQMYGFPSADPAEPSENGNFKFKFKFIFGCLYIYS